MRRMLTVLLSLIVVIGAAGCDNSSSDTTAPSGSTLATSTTTTAAPTTTTEATTTTSTATTTTSPDPAPGTAGGLTVDIGGGSGEVIPEWDRNTEADMASYRLWYSDDPGATKTLLAELPHDPSLLPGPAYSAGGGRTAYVDLRAQIEGKHCYQVSAVDAAGHEGARCAEVCLPVEPPPAPSGFDVNTGGGSAEVMIQWTRVPAPDVAVYHLWFSEFPGDTKSFLDTVAHDTAALTGPAHNMGGGKTAYIDFPRLLENGRNCYQVSTVDTASNEGPRTVELCLAGL